jgi:hypothetical protein
MKKHIVFLFVLISLGNLLKAQKPNRDKIESLKIGFISNQLNLSPEEAERFWPVYNKFSDEMSKLKKNAKLILLDEMGDASKMTNQEAEKHLQDMIQFKSNDLELIKKYSIEFKKVLPIQKVVMLYKAENEFKKELLKQLKERRRD